MMLTTTENKSNKPKLRHTIMVNMKNKNKLLLIITIVLILMGILYVALLYRKMMLAMYQHECVPTLIENVVPHIEKIFDINIPQNNKEIIVAKSAIPTDYSTFYICKITTTEQEINNFLSSLPKETELDEYDSNRDMRKLVPIPIPDWFISPPIKRGERGYFASKNGRLIVHLDNTNIKQQVLYLNGHYLTSLECPNNVPAKK